MSAERATAVGLAFAQTAEQFIESLSCEYLYDAFAPSIDDLPSVILQLQRKLIAERKTPNGDCLIEFTSEKSIKDIFIWLGDIAPSLEWCPDPDLDAKKYKKICQSLNQRLLWCLKTIIVERALVRGWFFAARIAEDAPLRILPFNLLMNVELHGNRWFDAFSYHSIALDRVTIFRVDMPEADRRSLLPKLLTPARLKDDIKKQSLSPMYIGMKADVFAILDQGLLEIEPIGGFPVFTTQEIRDFADLSQSNAERINTSQQKAGRPNADEPVRDAFLRRRLKKLPLLNKTSEVSEIFKDMTSAPELYPTKPQESTVNTKMTHLGYFRDRDWQLDVIERDLIKYASQLGKNNSKLIN